MGIEYSIIAMDDSVTQDIVLNAFSPYCTKKDDEEYLLDYGDEVYEDMIICNHCTLSLSFKESSKDIIESIEIIKPSDHPALEKAIFLLIHEYPMFIAGPDFPLMTANKKCMDLLKVEDIKTYEDTELVSSFDEFSNLLTSYE
ncbi:MAG: hypothetical protein J6583_10670 [Gilliamella sp.]|nr:hypothetical protein [Gilliamella sp.]MCO6554616.1 hypothetical protein [Gilliamella sp.]